MPITSTLTQEIRLFDEPLYAILGLLAHRNRREVPYPPLLDFAMIFRGGDWSHPMLRIYEDLKPKEKTTLDEMRAWALAQGEPHERLTAKLSIAQRIITKNIFGVNDVWKMNAVGVLFGDALEHAMEGRLKWVIAEDEHGPTFALSWKHTEVLVYPLAAIKSRLEAAEAVDVYALFAEYSSVFPFRQL